jgi:hypothetical protein
MASNARRNTRKEMPSGPGALFGLEDYNAVCTSELVIVHSMGVVVGRAVERIQI